MVGRMAEGERALMRGIILADDCTWPAAMPKNSWIAISDGLPELRTDVLFQIKGEQMMVGFLEEWKHDDEEFHFTDREWGYRLCDVMAWQTLPTPYKITA